MEQEEQSPLPTMLEDLTRIKSLIEKPENWTQNYYAKDEYGMTIHSSSDAAVCFCTLGALHRVIPMGSRGHTNRRADVRELLESLMGDDGVAQFNDTHTHEEVIAVFDKAIEIVADEIK